MVGNLVDLLEILDGVSQQDIEVAVRSMSPEDAQAILEALEHDPATMPPTPLDQAQALDPGYRERSHLRYLSDRLAKAVEDVERGKSRFLVVSMPPREGKSQLTSVFLVLWILHKHPEWPIGLISHDPSLAVKWGREVRALVQEKAEFLGVELARDAGAAAEWMTTKRGGVTSRSVGQSITGRGFKVLLVDDAVKDFADAHSPTKREALWNWWQGNASTRSNGPWLVVFIGTRWHEDDIIGRILSSEYDGDPDEWEKISFPAIAEEHDVLGRAPGEPLLSPIFEETKEEALARWAGIKAKSGTYVWNALYQQHPSAAKGSIFSVDWWRFWTTNPSHVSRGESGEPDGKVVLLDPGEDLATARWLDSWDMAFKATSSSDYVVGQRWAFLEAQRYLIYQERARLSFTQSLARMRIWADPGNPSVPYSHLVHERLVEDKANGTAVIDTLTKEISGLVPVNPTESKEARARAISPEAEAGNIVLPFPGDPGNEWVQDLLSELREFPTGAHDDQVDGLTQAVSRLRTPIRSSVVNPGSVTQLDSRRRAQVALQQTRRYSAGLR